jgi:hypothetical protein
MALKRAGRGHDPAGVDATPARALIVECPACPHPGRNLPPNWALAGPLLYVLFHYQHLSEVLKILKVFIHPLYLG